MTKVSNYMNLVTVESAINFTTAQHYKTCKHSETYRVGEGGTFNVDCRKL